MVTIILLQVFPHPAVAVLETPTGSLSAGFSCYSTDTIRSVRTTEDPSASTSAPPCTSSNKHLLVPGSSSVKIDSLPLDQSEKSTMHEIAYHLNSEASCGSASRSSPSPDGRAVREAIRIPACSPLFIQAHGGIGNIPVSWILPRAAVAHGLLSLGLDKLLANIFPEPRCYSVKGPQLSSPPKPAVMQEDYSYINRPETTTSSFFWRHKNVAEQAKSATTPSASVKTNGMVSGTRGLQQPLSDEAQATTNLYTGITERWRDDMAVEPLLVIPSPCLTAASSTVDNDQIDKYLGVCESRKCSGGLPRAAAFNTERCTVRSQKQHFLPRPNSNGQPRAPDNDADGMEAHVSKISKAGQRIFSY